MEKSHIQSIMKKIARSYYGYTFFDTEKSFPKLDEMKPNAGCTFPFPIDLTLNGVSLVANPSEKGNSNPNLI